MLTASWYTSWPDGTFIAYYYVVILAARAITLDNSEESNPSVDNGRQAPPWTWNDNHLQILAAVLGPGAYKAPRLRRNKVYIHVLNPQMPG